MSVIYDDKHLVLINMSNVVAISYGTEMSLLMPQQVHHALYIQTVNGECRTIYVKDKEEADHIMKECMIQENNGGKTYLPEPNTEEPK